MNMLPHISHHLFAAALTSEDQAARRVAPAAERPRQERGVATVLPLELVPAAEPAPERAVRPLRTVVAVGT